ncbi:acyltransferase family protein [Sphingobacterium detergens]|uniref:Fucose 4-O-acetylase-like acetyltransferase n=1 Tax=Sphingobacterium detergens TaxID=1145106 RepID=A0A420ALM1_SPHD1|nr:acyltransferase family protein [Sphingobacterium detergens]RKE45338.1 fucose 4-O-acetylase-like acetyltransferase [Sphingobacterium detergens]
MGKDYHFKMSAEELQSKVIDFLRFPLIVGVVFIHTDFSDIVMTGVKQISFVNYPVFSRIFFLFSRVIFEACVPLFFFISGFLFFYKTVGFSREIYLQKLKNRIRSLLVPYIFWNLLIILFLMLAQTFLSGSLVSGRNKLITDYSLLDWLWSFWDTSQVNPHMKKTLPINSPFWFIRDLMVVIVFSPIVYILIKKLKAYAVIILGLLWIFNPFFYLPGLSIVSFFFFTAGAYFSIHKMNFVEVLKPMLRALAPLYILIVVMALYFAGAGWWSYLYCAGVVVGLPLTITVSAYFIESGKWHLNPFLTNGSFFIYAYHRLPLVFVIKILFKWLHPRSDGALLLLYLACPAIVILLGLLIYSLLRQRLPRFTAIISGGR